MSSIRWILVLLAASLCAGARAELVPVAGRSNVVIRIAAANLTSGSGPNYDDFGIRLLQGLRPDIIAIQEFNYGGRLPPDIQSLVNQITRTNGSAWFRESGSGYSIPNGIISRWPIRRSGSWDDLEIPDRGFAWAEIDLPGETDLYVVSVHLKAGSSTSERNRRSNQATQLRSQISTNFPPDAWIVVAGDLNTYSTTEPCITTLSTFLKTSPDAVDNTGDPDTNAGRSSPYDHVFASHTLATNQIPTTIGSQSFANGLVFDSRVYTPLTDVPPVQAGDSGVSGMQHMAVVKDFRITITTTNWVDVAAPRLQLQTAQRVTWTGPSQLTFTVEGSISLPVWTPLGTATSTTTNYAFTNSAPSQTEMFYRTRIP